MQAADSEGTTETPCNSICTQSRFTLGEDIADGGGLAQTYRAWSDRFASDPSGEKHDK